MAELTPRRIKDSATVLSQVMLPSMANPAGYGHGGESLKLMDNTAGVCAARHARSGCVTVGIDHVSFHAPVPIGTLAVCRAYMTYTSGRSMEVAVSIDAEDFINGTAQCCMTAYFVFVAIDPETMKSKEVPPLELLGEAERAEFAAGERRMQERRDAARTCWLPLY